MQCGAKTKETPLFVLHEMSTIKGRSYWRRRRDIAHSVDSHVYDLMEQLDSTGDTNRC